MTISANGHHQKRATLFAHVSTQ
jgi:site-specific DNA recombinase